MTARVLHKETWYNTISFVDPWVTLFWGSTGRRPHIGGNAFDTFDENGILIHPYGPHIFHTNSKRVFAYLSRFTDWRFYEHKVRAKVDGKLYSVPINRLTLNGVHNLDLDEAGAAAFRTGPHSEKRD